MYGHASAQIPLSMTQLDPRGAVLSPVLSPTMQMPTEKSSQFDIVDPELEFKDGVYFDFSAPPSVVLPAEKVMFGTGKACALPPPTTLPEALKRIKELENRIAQLEAEKVATAAAHSAQLVDVVASAVAHPIITPTVALEMAAPYIEFREALINIPSKRYAAVFAADSTGGSNIYRSAKFVMPEAAKVTTSFVALLNYTAEFGSEYITHIEDTTPRIEDMVRALSLIPYYYIGGFEIIHAALRKAIPRSRVPNLADCGSLKEYFQKTTDTIVQTISAGVYVEAFASIESAFRAMVPESTVPKLENCSGSRDHLFKMVAAIITRMETGPPQPRSPRKRNTVPGMPATPPRSVVKTTSFVSLAKRPRVVNEPVQ